MGYIDNNLISGESVRYRARLHWIVLLKSAAITFVLIVVAGLIFYIAFSGAAPDQSSILKWLGVGLLLIAVVPIAVAGLKRRSAEFAVTNKRVILKVGAVTNQTEEMFLNKIESVGVEQTVAGRLLGYGTISIRGTGGSLEPFHRVSAPLEFRRQIQEQIGKAFDPSTHSTSSGN